MKEDESSQDHRVPEESRIYIVFRKDSLLIRQISYVLHKKETITII
jgi:hypothetical protein